MSKPKPRLIVLIMVCQHIQSEVLIHLVPKVLEPNNIHFDGYDPLTNYRDESMKVKKESRRD